jgi:ferric-chelate reductase
MSSDHIRWIDETLIRALQTAPPSLSVSICIHVTGAPAATEVPLHSYGSNGDTKPVNDHFHSELVMLPDGKATEKNENSLIAMESVKLQNGRPDLPVILKDEVEMATGRMSVSGNSIFIFTSTD